MANFIVISSSEDLHSIVRSKFKKDCYQLNDDNFLVSFEGTSKQLCDELNASEGLYGNIVVLNFSGYWGWAGGDLWEWISEHSK